MPVDEMAEQLGLPVSAERTYHTAAGFVLGELGRLPEVGESFDAYGWRFEVVDLDGRRIDKILAQRIAGARRRAAAGLRPARCALARSAQNIWIASE